jgi:hypothetical protein
MEEASSPVEAFKLLSDLRTFDTNISHPEELSHFQGLKTEKY